MLISHDWIQLSCIVRVVILSVGVAFSIQWWTECIWVFPFFSHNPWRPKMLFWNVAEQWLPLLWRVPPLLNIELGLGWELLLLWDMWDWLWPLSLKAIVFLILPYSFIQTASNISTSLYFIISGAQSVPWGPSLSKVESHEKKLFFYSELSL